MEDIHHYNKKIEYSLKKIKVAAIPEENRTALLAFYRSCVADGISNGKLHRYLDDFVNLTRNNPKKYVEYTKIDIEEIIVRLEQSKYTEWTKYSYKIGLRKFFKWLRGTEDFPPEVKWFKLRQKACNGKLPEELLTEVEVKQMIAAAHKPRDRALVAVLYESGCRIYEVMTMRIKNVTFDKHGAVITVSGKTGSRRVRLVVSIGYLQDWMNNHPFNGELNAFLWAKESSPRCIVEKFE